MKITNLRWMHFLIAIAVSPISAYGVFWVSLYALAELSEGWHPAWFGDSSHAEIVVVVPDSSPEGFSAEMIPVASVAGYSASHPDATFLVSADRQNQLKKRLENDLHLSWNTFDIKEIADGQQEITLYFMDRTDDSHGSRYKASKNSVELESYRYISDRGGMGIVFMAMFVTAAVQVIVLGYFLIRAIRGPQRNSKTSVVDGESRLGP
jgi:hypothetical protein